MSGLKVKKGDTVIVLSGKDKGETGEVLRALPSKGKVVVQGVNVAIRHTKPRSATDKGGRIEKEMPIDASNVAVVTGGKATRVGYRVDADGTKTRIARKGGGAL
jgi:large subunit ribosomal protein L24